jgi:precorrin-6B methylase 2
MKHLTIQEDRDVFLDYGSGMGRVVVLAATYPFRKVIGIEVSSELNAIAKDNVRRAYKRLKCKDIDLITGDAASYVVPPEVNYVYLYNPFRGETLSRVFDNIRKSLDVTDRKLTLIYKKRIAFEEKMPGRDWLEKRWEFPCRHGQKCIVYQNHGVTH